MLAGASYLDLTFSFTVSNPSIYKYLHEVCGMLMHTLKLPGLPDIHEELQDISRRFKTSRRYLNPITGCVGALDGIKPEIMKPKTDLHPAAYFCRKGYYALPEKALVDSGYRFLSYSSRSVGSTHDSFVHSVSS